MADFSDSVPQITKAIQLLQDAISEEAIDEKQVRADIVSAVSILQGVLGVAAVAPDPPDGQAIGAHH